MTDLPIIFSAPMVLALLAGRKTQTRRLAWKDPIDTPFYPEDKLDAAEARGWVVVPKKDSTGTITYKPSPWQKVAPGDRLYVREAWRVGKPHDARKPVDILPACFAQGKGVTVLYEAGGWRSISPDGRDEPQFPEDQPMPDWAGKSRRSFHLPREMTRLTLIVEATKVEPLQDISEAEAIAEGIERVKDGPFGWRDYEWTDQPGRGTGVVASFMTLWDSIHGPDGWTSNPDVVALTFRVVKENIDRIKEAA